MSLEIYTDKKYIPDGVDLIKDAEKRFPIVQNAVPKTDDIETALKVDEATYVDNTMFKDDGI